jgi:hypothetical protein
MTRPDYLNPANPRIRNAAVFALVFAVAAITALSAFPGSTSLFQPMMPAAQQKVAGQWMADLQERDDGLVQFTLRYEERKGDSFNSWNNSNGIVLNQLQGLTRDQAMSSGGVEVKFQIKRDAGSFDCEGWFRVGRGAGHFLFAPNRAFIPELNRRGISGTLADSQLFTLARTDVGFAVLEELKSQAYPLPSMGQLVRMSEHGVRLEFLKGLKTFGAKVASIEMLLSLRDTGVSVRYLEELNRYGFRNLSAEDLIRGRSQGVSTSYLEVLAKQGYTGLSLDELIRLRQRGVSASFIQALRAEGYPKLALEQLTKLRDAGVSSSFIQDLKQLGYERLSIEELIRLRVNGVSSSFIRRVKGSGASGPTVDELIELRNRGTQKFK